MTPAVPVSADSQHSGDEVAVGHHADYPSQPGPCGRTPPAVRDLRDQRPVSLLMSRQAIEIGVTETLRAAAKRVRVTAQRPVGDKPGASVCSSLSNPIRPTNTLATIRRTSAGTGQDQKAALSAGLASTMGHSTTLPPARRRRWPAKLWSVLPLRAACTSTLTITRSAPTMTGS